MSQGLIIYLGVVGGILALIAARVFVWLRRAELRDLQRLQRERKLPVRTSSPIPDPVDTANEEAKQAITARFSVSRRLLLPLLVAVGAFAVGVPFLDLVPAATVTLVAGAFTVIIGLALRPMIENATAGLVISASKLISVGDTLDIGDDYYGTVEDITATHTTIKLWDWRRYVLSNSRMLDSDFVNYSLHDSYVWAYVEFWVDYTADLDEVERLVVEVASASDAFADYEAPRMWLMGAGQDAVKCWAAAWANSPQEGWRLKHDMRKGLITALAGRGWAPRAHRLIHSSGDAPRPPEPGRPPAS